MVYVGANGEVCKGERPLPFYRRAMAVFGEFRQTHPKIFAVLVVLFALVIRNVFSDNPLADGKIPASETLPNGHWDRLAKDDTLMKRLSMHLEGKRDYDLENNRKLHSGEMKIMFDLVDFGGVDGVRFEKGGIGNLEEFRGTRCSSTRSSITAYFCGANVAMNQNAALKEESKHSHYGVNSFRNYIRCQREEGQKKGNLTRSVYRLGIGCRDSLAGYSHAFSIVTQPDGSYLWLQSYIQQYSLQKWMSQKNADGSIRGKLTYAQLMEKLDRLDRLMSINSWTEQTNEDYLDLFFVDKNVDTMKRKNEIVASKWEPTHRLELFAWDEACEYPLPEVNGEKEEKEDDDVDSINQPYVGNKKCETEMLLKGLEDLEKLGGTENLTEMIKNSLQWD